MLLPIGDDDRELSGASYITWGLIVVNLAVFFVLQNGVGGDVFTSGWSAVPYEITHGVDLVGTESLRVGDDVIQIPQAPGPSPIYLTILSAMFMHGGLWHLFGNLLYLWIFGDNVEHRFGHRVFLVFYLVSGLAATLAQVGLDPSSVVPTLGASGAISGVLGAYLVLFPRNKVHALLFIWVISIPALVAIGAWIVFQMVEGYGALQLGTSAGGVAYGAHLGGFAAGSLIALVLRRFIREERPSVLSNTAKHSQRYW